MKRYFCLVSVFILALLLMQPSYSTILNDLYTANLPVTQRTDDLSKQAIDKALQQVFIKVSGNPNVATLETIKKSLGQALSYVKSYKYTSYTTAAGQQALMLDVTFDSRAVNQLLRQAKQAIWGSKRPLILVWLVVKDNGEMAIASNSSADFVADALQTNARRRGLPILLPLGDLDDLQRVSAKDIWQLNPKLVQAASKRYQANDILEGRVAAKTDGSWQSQWLLNLNGEYMTWNIQGNSINQVIAKAIDDVTNAMAARLAVLADDSLKKEYTLKITGVNGLDDFADVIKYLRKLTPVIQAETVTVDPDYLVIKVTATGGQSTLIRAIEKSDKLVPVQFQDQTEDNSQAALTFQWVSKQRLVHQSLTKQDESTKVPEQNQI